jgi:hypothetical protein
VAFEEFPVLSSVRKTDAVKRFAVTARVDETDDGNVEVLSHLPRGEASTVGWRWKDHSDLNSRRGRC